MGRCASAEAALAAGRSWALQGVPAWCSPRLRHTCSPPPPAAQVMVTDQEHVANQMSAAFGVYPLLVPSLSDVRVEDLVDAARAYAREAGIWDGYGTGGKGRGGGEGVLAKCVPCCIDA